MRLLKSYSVFLLLLLFIASACNEKIDKDASAPQDQVQLRDLKEIIQTGKLQAIIENSSTSYFIYKGQPMGFEYELLSRFADHVGVELEVISIDEVNQMFDALKKNQGDVIAANLTITKERRKKVEFSEPILNTKQVLVQRYLNKEEEEKGKELIESALDLDNKEVYVQRSSSFFDRLQHLSEEIGSEIQIKEVGENLTVEQMIEKVAEGEIDYTVADQHVAKINSAYYRNLHIRTELSLEQKVAWAMRKESADLHLILNDWLRKFKKTTDFRVIYLKYYGNTKLFRNRVSNKLFTSRSGRLSNYDEVIKKNAEKIGWDWRLLTSMIYQESRFDPTAQSWAGAKGLMQILPSTAAEYGVDSTLSPERSIEIGVLYLDWINDQFRSRVKDSTERQKFVLAAYNVGLGHVFDAMRLADKYDLNPQLWDNNVAEMILKKSDPQYYKDSIAHYGYCRGREPYNYVKEIYNRYNDYLNITEDQDEMLSYEANSI